MPIKIDQYVYGRCHASAYTATTPSHPGSMLVHAAGHSTTVYVMISNENGVSKSEWNANKYSNKNRLAAVDDKNRMRMGKERAGKIGGVASAGVVINSFLI